MAFYHVAAITEKVTRKGGIADDIGATVMTDHVFDIGNSLHHQALPYLKGKQGCVLADYEQMHMIRCGCSLLYQIAVAKGKGICIHYDGGAVPFHPKALKGVKIVGKACGSVFHKYQLAIDPCDLIKSKIPEELFRAELGIYEDVVNCFSTPLTQTLLAVLSILSPLISMISL